jgi:tetratricopeptide (TPR) repeat protein
MVEPGVFVKEFVMKFKLNAVATVCLLGTLLGCAPLMPGAPPLMGSALAPSRGQASTVPVKVAPAPAINAAMPSSAALFSMGLAAHGAGQLALASQRYEEVLKLNPEHVGALNALAVIYAQSGRTNEALTLFARASSLAPGAAHVRNNAGYALLRDGRLDEAEIALNKARELDPSNAQTQQNLELLASARAKRQSAALVVPSAGGNRAGPRLVMVAPNILELQTPTSASALAPVVDLVDLRGVRLEVSNGVGIRRLARRTADRLATEGVSTARLTNALPYRQARTEIQFVAGQSLAAQALQSRMPVATQAVAASRLSAGVQLRLVLGHDMAGRALAAWLDAQARPQVASHMQSGWRWS